MSGNELAKEDLEESDFIFRQQSFRNYVNTNRFLFDWSNLILFVYSSRYNVDDWGDEDYYSTIDQQIIFNEIGQLTTLN